MTFFVVPVLVIEGVTPFQAIKRSTTLLKETGVTRSPRTSASAWLTWPSLSIAVVPAVVVASSEIALALVVLFFSAGAPWRDRLLMTLDGIFRVTCISTPRRARAPYFPRPCFDTPTSTRKTEGVGVVATRPPTVVAARPTPPRPDQPPRRARLLGSPRKRRG